MSIGLDERVVKATPAATEGAVSNWDDEITGFGLKVFAQTPRHRRPLATGAGRRASAFDMIRSCSKSIGYI